MPAKSKKQQRFFALVHAYKNGKIKHPSESVRRAAESISDEDARHFAATSHGGLPEKAAEFIRNILSEKKAWTKTPVRIQNRNAVYDFESLEEACQYLASIGTLSYDEVEKMLRDREGMINGFQVVYSGEKSAEIVDIDPGHRRNALLRARRIADTITAPTDNSEEVARLEKDVKKKKEHVERLINDLSGAASVSGNALAAISGLFSGD